MPLPPLMAGGQPSEVVVARIAALRASICRDMFAGSIKLSFKPALTDKGQVSIGLDLLINGPVLPSVAKGNRVSLGELHKKTVYRFGPFQLDSGRATLTRNGKQLKLQDLPFRMLAILVEKAGEIVSPRRASPAPLARRTLSLSSITAWESRSGKSVMHSETMRTPPAMWKPCHGKATGFWRRSLRSQSQRFRSVPSLRR